MEARVLVPSQSDLWPGESWWCETAPGTASGFKGVQRFDKQWRARVWIKGKGTRTVCTASTAKEAAWLLARWRHYPCELSSPEKRPGKGSNGTGRSSDAGARAPLSPRRLDASNLGGWLCRVVHVSPASGRTPDTRGAWSASPRRGLVFRWTGRPGLVTYRVIIRDIFPSGILASRLPDLTLQPSPATAPPARDTAVPA